MRGYSPAPGTYVSISRYGSVGVNGEVIGRVQKDRHFRTGFQPHTCWQVIPVAGGPSTSACFGTQRDAAEWLRKAGLR